MAIINFSGIASGIDSSALIEALLDQQRQARVDPLEKRITELQNTNSTLEELSTLTSSLDNITTKFRTLAGGAIFKDGTSSSPGVLEAEVSNAAEPGTYGITVTQLASNATFSFDDRYGSTDSALDGTINNGDPVADRTVSIDVGTGGFAETVDVVLTDSSTLNDFVSDFNSQSDLATASVVNTGTSGGPSYAVVITSNTTGTAEGTITLNSVGAGISALGSNTLDQATNAGLTLDGIGTTIVRESNTVNNVIEGVSLQLKAVGSSTLTIGVDEDTTATAVEEFVNAYNEIVDFINENDVVERQETSTEITNIFGPFASTSLDENLLSSIRAAFSSSSISGGSSNILADLGITTERDGTLLFNREQFDTALSNGPDDVKQILGNLGESLSSVNGTLAQYTRFKGNIDLSIDANESLIDGMQDSISRAESSLAEQEQSLIQRFARLEGLIGELQSQQASLSGVLAGLST